MPSLSRNPDALRDYTILETYEAGIVLTGAEVKSVKGGDCSLKGSYAMLRANAAWLVGARIAPYRHAIAADQEPTRDRKLLLRREEFRSLIGKLAVGGLTLVPLSVYTTAGIVKVGLGLGRGKKRHDKRAAIKRRETDRKIRRALRQRDTH